MLFSLLPFLAGQLSTTCRRNVGVGIFAPIGTTVIGSHLAGGAIGSVLGMIRSQELISSFSDDLTAIVDGYGSKDSWAI